MKTIVINTENKSAVKFLYELAKKLGLKTIVLTDIKKEDLALIRAIDEGMKCRKHSVKTSSILEKLLSSNLN